MTSKPSRPPETDPQHPTAAAEALSLAAEAAASAWAQPMEPEACSQAISQLYSVLRDLGIATKGLARFRITLAPPSPCDREFTRHVITSSAWLLGACRSLDGVLAAEGLGPPACPGPGDALCLAARIAIIAWRQPSGTAADRDATAGHLMTAIAFLSKATLNLAGYTPRRHAISLLVIGAGLAEARVCLASAIQIADGQAARRHGHEATRMS